MTVSRLHSIVLVVAVLASASWSRIVVAQDDAQQRALKRAQFMLRQLNNEKAALQGENEALAMKVTQLEGEVNRLRAELDQAQTRSEALVGRFTERVESANERIRRTDERLVETTEKYREAVSRLRDTEAERDRFQGELETVRRDLADSESRNALLVDANLEMAELYEDKGFAQVLWKKEPVTGLREVQVENILQEYRLRVENLKREAEPLAQTAPEAR